MVGSGRTAIAVIDVAGHGATRAPFASALAGTMRVSLLADESPSLALHRADEQLRTFNDEFPFAVGFVAVLDPALRTVSFASAGHDVAFALAPDGFCTALEPTGPMLGIPYTVNICDAVFRLEPYATLVIATDGVGDSRCAGSRAFFGARGTAHALGRSRAHGGDPARAVIDAACAYAGGRKADDMGIAVAVIDPLPNV
jgi:serine phosphatase RsbU (regulator of sigma subunit)